MKIGISIVMFTLFVCLTVAQIAQAKICQYTILELVESSDLIVLAEFMESKGVFNPYTDLKAEFIKDVTYKIKEVLKGKYDEDILQLDYEKMNPKRSISVKDGGVVSSSIGETVVLFLTREKIIFEGFQGKINLQKDTKKAYVDGLKEIIKIASIEDNNLKARELTSAFHSDNGELKLMAKESIVGSGNLIDKEYGPDLVDVLENDKEDRFLRYKAAGRLGDINADNALEVLSKYLYDNDEIVRKACAESLGELGDKRAIQILEEFLQKEKWEPARGSAENSIERLKIK